MRNGKTKYRFPLIMRMNRNWITSDYEALHTPLMTREKEPDNNMVLRQGGTDNSTSQHKAAITD